MLAHIMARMVTRLHFLGATRMVTGSSFLVHHGHTRVLIDCGLVQGSPEMVVKNCEQFQFDPSELKAVVVTNAQLDHSGLVPRLVEEGFRGRVLTTAVTKDLLSVVWQDYVQLQQSHAAVGTPRSPTDEPPLYMQLEVERALSRCEGVSYDTMLDVAPHVRLQFRSAGHIPGGAIVELWIDNLKMLFSGDLGRRGISNAGDPAMIEETDVLVLESTYGGHTHTAVPETLSEFGQVISKTLAAGGCVLMPVYAVGQAQDVLSAVNQLIANGMLEGPRVYLDSPLAVQATDLYARHLEPIHVEASRLIRYTPANPRAGVTFTETADRSREISREGPAIILAGNGMCESGRIQDHLTLHIDDPRSCVIFTDYQASGTLGRRLVDGAAYVRIHGKILPVKAQIHSFYGLSAHADQPDLLNWVGGLCRAKPSVFLVHGEIPNMTALADALSSQYGIRAVIPEWREMTLLSSR
jgi:metallo-beta-lactamase family protein